MVVTAEVRASLGDLLRRLLTDHLHELDAAQLRQLAALLLHFGVWESTQGASDAPPLFAPLLTIIPLTDWNALSAFVVFAAEYIRLLLAYYSGG